MTDDDDFYYSFCTVSNKDQHSQSAKNMYTYYNYFNVKVVYACFWDFNNVFIFVPHEVLGLDRLRYVYTFHLQL